MNFSAALLTDVSQFSLPNDGNGDHRSTFLDWMAGIDFLKVSVFETELVVREKFHRFTVQGADKNGDLSAGFGRSKDKLTAATIAACEMLERFVSRAVLRDSAQLAAPMSVFVEDGGIDVRESLAPLIFPTAGYHSSNGWAVHFSIQEAIERSVREALERHILLLSYLKYGWSGFLFNEKVRFEKAQITPGIARVSVGGFKAGIVLTEGDEAPGVTFGYLCREAEGFEQSSNWLGAFFETYEQWIDLTKREEPADTSVIEKYQWHYLKEKRPTLSAISAQEIELGALRGGLAVFDLRSVFDCPCPIYAAFTFGQDFIPLFHRQKLSLPEQENLKKILIRYGVDAELPEYHPIL